MSHWLILLVIIGVLVVGTAYGSVVDGSAYKEGESNHSGIGVICLTCDFPHDTLFTDASGHFGTWYAVSGGRYHDFEYSCPGFLTDTLHHWIPRLSQVTLPPITLERGLCGPLSGTLSGDDYQVLCDISVESGKTLNILPSTRLLFTGNYEFNIHGLLRAIGTPDSPIVFTVEDPTKGSRWGGIRFYDNKDTCRLEYCRIEYGEATYGGGIYCEKSDPVIRFCTIANNEAEWYGGGLYCDGSSPRLENCTITRNSANDGCAIYCVSIHPPPWPGSYVEAINTIIYDDYCLEPIVELGLASFTATYCDIEVDWPGAGNRNCDPEFCYPDTGNYYLWDTSCCVGAGEYGDDIGAYGIGCFSGAGGQWKPYGHRYAIVVMGGSVTDQMYRWYWNDTSGKIWTLMDWGFAPEDIIYLSYGDSATVHPELVDGISTKANVKAAFDTIAAKVTYDDLVHVWWVDHGNTSGFEVHGGFVYFTELKEWIDGINCRVFIGAYNPCYSGAIMPHMQSLCNDERRVITATSVNASQGNSYGWAGMWRLALRGGRPDDTVPWYADKNQDGYIALDEAYEWETPHSNNAGEYPLFDDNCDGAGGDLTIPATYDSSGQDSTKDGFYGQFYSLMAWYDRDAKDYGLNPFLTTSPSLSDPNLKQWLDSLEIEIEWSTGAPLPKPVCRGASSLIGDKIYLFGGHPCPAPIHYVYDIGTNTWSTGAAPLPTHGSLIRGFAHNGKVYVFGGHTLGSDDMRRYDPAANSWELLSSPYPDSWRECCKYGAAAVGDKIYYYYMEERYRYMPIQAFWEYDITNDLWTEKPAPPAPKRMYSASASDGNYCYAVGGLSHDNLNPIRDVLRYDPSSGTWETVDPLPEPIAFADGDFLKSHLFIAGGGAGYGPWPASDRVYCWKEGEGWMLATPLPTPVGSPHVELATIDSTDYIFVFGGYNNGYLNTFYIGEIKNSVPVEEQEILPSPSDYALSQNYPNPFNPITEIKYTLPHDSYVRLEVYSTLGQKVATLVDQRQTAGYKSLRWDASSLASGIYFYRISAADFTSTRKMVLLK